MKQLLSKFESILGEYVALYQQQRCVLRERAAEKDREIVRMATDREELVLKLKQVGHLVLQLVNGQREDNSGKKSYIKKPQFCLNLAITFLSFPQF